MVVDRDVSHIDGLAGGGHGGDAARQVANIQALVFRIENQRLSLLLLRLTNNIDIQRPWEKFALEKFSRLGIKVVAWTGQIF